ncbi:hypothetical protein B0T25DRAFT_293869 [Lasiosphaeria hispida]|uniref:Uncharacterized protein n=1 Tax=Lasiosphaeria hispida TaxID=260671 RepID=A0AAJ0HCZ4_9PEZI|nr:hypothetical protein B0T25DRAFT_293869 [Lasiosphaeria hispida]
MSMNQFHSFTLLTIASLTPANCALKISAVPTIIIGIQTKMANSGANTDISGHSSAADASNLERQEWLDLWLQDPTLPINDGRLSTTPTQRLSGTLAALAQFEEDFSQNGRDGA